MQVVLLKWQMPQELLGNALMLLMLQATPQPLLEKVLRSGQPVLWDLLFLERL
jgi:hypothetical protein